MQQQRLVGVAPGPPFAVETWSGTSRHLLQALQRRGFDVAGVDGSHGRVADLAARATTLSTRRSRWKARYQLSGASRVAATRRARRRMSTLGSAPDVMLQIGAWYDLTSSPGDPICCSYHDGNVLVHARSEDLPLGPGAAIVRRRAAGERRVYDRLDLIFTMSDWLRGSFVEDFGQSPDKVITVGAGPNFDEVPQPPGREGRAPVFLFVGRDFVRKGGPEVLEAFRRVRECRPDARLLLVGPPHAPQAAAGVTYVGPVSRESPEGAARLARLYEEATVFVLPSRYEPFGVALLEAMAWGLPCIAADVCAMPEIVEEGVTGLLAPPHASEALAARMLELAEDPHRALRMGAAGLARQRERFTWDTVAGRIHDALSALQVPR